METAKISRRVFSYLIDLIVLFGIAILLGSLLFFYTSLPWYFSLVITILICYVFFVLVNTLLMKLTKGRTIGSFVFGIKTVNKDESDILASSAFVKNLYIGLLPFVIVNGIYWLVIKSESSIFDKITDTIVVKISKSNI